MSILPLNEQSEQNLLTGIVESCQANTVRIYHENSYWNAYKAASCLVQPEKNDKILFVTLTDGTAFVLAVLTKARAETVLQFQGKITLQSLSELELSAPKTSLHSQEVLIQTEKYTLIAHTLKSMGNFIETIYNRAISRFTFSTKIVSDHDETQAHTSRLAVEKEAIVQADTLTQNATTLIKMDAKQIHVA